MLQGKDKQTVTLIKDSGKNVWSGNVTVDKYGEYKYYFLLYYGSMIKIYCDDDGYYGTGMLTDLNKLTPYDLVVYKKDFLHLNG